MKSSRWPLGRELLLFLSLTTVSIAGPTGGHDVATTPVELNTAEQQAKAAFIYNFAKFTTWPTNLVGNSDSPIIIGIFGRDSLEWALRKIVAGKHIDQHAIAVRVCTTVEETQQCQVLYVCRSEFQHWPEILNQLSRLPILTVSDIPDFAKNGGMLEIQSKEGEAVRFTANVVASDKAGLVISSKLLRLAHDVLQSTNQREAP